MHHDSIAILAQSGLVHQHTIQAVNAGRLRYGVMFDSACVT